MDVDKLPGVMEVGELVDAALAGFDRRETVTIPPLPDEGQWTAFETARKVMLPNFSQAHAAERYRMTHPVSFFTPNAVGHESNVEN
jgi:short-subunit dehydrogenase